MLSKLYTENGLIFIPVARKPPRVSGMPLHGPMSDMMINFAYINRSKPDVLRRGGRGFPIGFKYVPWAIVHGLLVCCPPHRRHEVCYLQ